MSRNVIAEFLKLDSTEKKNIDVVEPRDGGIVVKVKLHNSAEARWVIKNKTSYIEFVVRARDDFDKTLFMSKFVEGLMAEIVREKIKTGAELTFPPYEVLIRIDLKDFAGVREVLDRGWMSRLVGDIWRAVDYIKREIVDKVAPELIDTEYIINNL